MSEDAACILLAEAVAYVAWYVWDAIRQHGNDDNPFGGW